MARDFRVSEGISGLWHYHLSNRNNPSEALCGARTMGTHIALDDWEKPFGAHFPKAPTWCKACAASRGDYRGSVDGGDGGERQDENGL